MTLNEAKLAYQTGQIVSHKDNKDNWRNSGQTMNSISCFSDNETGVYLKHSHVFINIEDLVAPF